MKGIIFNLLETVVAREHGEAAWDDLLERCRLNGAYTSLGSYDDAEFLKLLDATSSLTNIATPENLAWFGRKALPLLAASYGSFFEPHRSARTFMLTLNEVIHPEVRKIYPGADVPTFRFDEPDERTLVMHYESARKLCRFAEGLVLGAGDHFEQEIQIEQTECMHRGDPRCLIRCTFDPA